MFRNFDLNFILWVQNIEIWNHFSQSLANFLDKPKIKLTFHVFQVVSLDFSRNYSKPQSLYREKPTYESLDVGGELRIVLSPRAFIKRESYKRLAPRIARFFALLSPRSNTGGEARIFSKSQLIYTGKLAKLFIG